MIITSDDIRKQIKKAFDQDKGFFQKKLWKTQSIKDKKFYSPSFSQLKDDYEAAKVKTISDFKPRVTTIQKLASNPNTIFDCDNTARKLRQTLNDIHYLQYLSGVHVMSYEYAAFQITAEQEMFSLGGKSMIKIHDFVMVFTEQGIAFADFMRNKVWKINDEKPHVIGIGE